MVAGGLVRFSAHHYTCATPSHQLTKRLDHEQTCSSAQTTKQQTVDETKPRSTEKNTQQKTFGEEPGFRTSIWKSADRQTLTGVVLTIHRLALLRTFTT